MIESWETMIPDEQNSISTLNNFFCGMHVLVGMADSAYCLDGKQLILMGLLK